jgi:hypothetical protein
VLKRRWWWRNTRKDNLPNYAEGPISFDYNNFLWTQWRKDEVTHELNTFKEKCAQVNKQKKEEFETSSKKSDGDAGEPVFTPGRKSGEGEDEKMCLYAKLDANYHLTNKKALFWNMMNYYK